MFQNVQKKTLRQILGIMRGMSAPTGKSVGSSGIGLVTAKRFVQEGAYVFITGRRQSELDKAKGILGKNVTTLQGDVAILEDLDRLYETVKSEKGKLDIVVANAGFMEFGFLANATPEHYDKTFNINARGTFFTVKSFSRHGLPDSLQPKPPGSYSKSGRLAAACSRASRPTEM
jgi:NAD(P)-dependent dehydrogenase (short-subunit alcohol dehydrogenase family)